jgi:hypothetical protein
LPGGNQKKVKEIIELSGACRDQTRIRIRLAFSGKLKELILDLLNENFYLRVDDQGFLTGELTGTFEEISRVIELLKIKGFKF